MLVVRMIKVQGHPRSIVTFTLLIYCLVLCVSLCHSPAKAQQSSDSFAQTFNSTTESSNLISGAIVTGVPNKPSHIELATIENANQLIGVIDTLPLVALSSENKKIPVILTGSTSAFVSDINGPVKNGDKITASPIAGVGMLATSNGQIVGTAKSDFKENEGETRTITDKEGNKKTIRIQKLALHVGVSYYNAPSNSILPSFMHNIADTLAGKPVPLIRILTGLVILIIAFTYTIVITYSSTKSTISALGRNPLGSKQIMKGQQRSILMAFLVISGALLAVYLIIVI